MSDRTPPAWPEDRRKELAALQTLLNEASSINSGSHCLERISKCIGIAEALLLSDISTGRQSFMQWLIGQAAAPKT